MRLSIVILACVFLSACAGGGTLNSLNHVYQNGSVVIAPQNPVSIDSKFAPLPANQIETGVVDQKNVQQTVVDRRSPDQERMDERRRSDRALEPRPDRGKAQRERVVLQETTGQGPEISLFIKRDEPREEDLNSLLTADYQRRFDIPIVFNDAVQYFVTYFTTEKRRVFANWLKRSKRYVPMINGIMREQGLPEDLIYLAMIESGFNPKAYSSMKACGPWQFIYETGGRYGLRVNHWVDERRDPEKSTVAAALYLKDLFNQFGSWHLAAAGYNAGEKRIERAVEKHETTDFWELTKYNTLPKETREYIPKLLAAAIVAKTPEKFGFIDIDYDQPVKFVTERVPGGTSLAAVAKAAATDTSSVRALNPEILTGIIPPDVDDYIIKLPDRVRRDKFRDELAIALKKERRIQQVVSYTCKKRDSLAGITKRFKVNEADILLVNNCDNNLSVKQGTVIFVPRFQKGDEPVEVTAIDRPSESRSVTSDVAAPPEKQRETRLTQVKVVSKTTSRGADYHVVRRGESLAGISEKYGIDQTTLKEINRLNKSQIYPNMRLQLTSHARKRERPATTAIYHTVRRGETLSEIAEKYDMDMGKLRGLNRLKKSGIRSGMRLRVSTVKVIPATRG